MGMTKDNPRPPGQDSAAAKGRRCSPSDDASGAATRQEQARAAAPETLPRPGAGPWRRRAARWAVGVLTALWAAIGPHGVERPGAAAAEPSARGARSPAIPRATVARDFDGDARSDILWRHPNGELSVWLMDGMRIRSSSVLASGDAGASIQGIGDFDGNGTADILWRADTPPTLQVWLMRGGTVTARRDAAARPPRGGTLQASGDFDGNGRSDLLWRLRSGSSLLWILDGWRPGTGSAPLPRMPHGWEIGGAGDLDGDGRTDILWRDGVTGATRAWFMDGARLVEARRTWDQRNRSWLIAGIGDLNGDGRGDVLWRHAGGTVEVWFTEGRGPGLGSATIGRVDPEWRVEALGDYDGNGRVDILWRTATGDPYLWLMNGATLVRAGVPTAGASPEVVAPSGPVVAPPSRAVSDTRPAAPVVGYGVLAVPPRPDYTVPPPSDWIDRGLVLDTGAHGRAWDVLMEGMTPSALVKRGDTFLLYYVGSPDYIDDPANVGPKDRAIGVATSADLVRWTKLEGNPVISWSLSGNPEEGAPSAGVLATGNRVVAYYGANSASGPTTSGVWADVRRATSRNGLDFVDRGKVVDHADGSVYGHGDELHSNLALEHDGVWYAYYVPNGTPESATLGVAYGPAAASLATSARVSSAGASVRARGPASVVRLGPDQVAFFISFGSDMDVRTTTLDRLTELSAPVVTYSGLPGFGRIVFLDAERQTWFMLYNAWTHIGLMTAPLDGAADGTPPTAPPRLRATARRHDLVKLRWREARDPDTGILEYQVYRDGVLVGTTRKRVFRDSGRAERTRYVYEVRAVNLHDTVGPPSTVAVTTPADLTPPSIARVTAGGDSGELTVRFDEPVTTRSAETAAHYAVPGLSVLGATLDADLRTVTLRTTSQSPNRRYTLTAKRIADRAARPNTGSSTCAYTYTSAPGLVAYWRLDETTGRVVADTSGSRHDGRAIGGPGRVRGPVGGAFAFDGVDDYVSIEDTPVLDATVSGSFTVTGWVSATTAPPATTTANRAYTLFRSPNARILYDSSLRFAAHVRTSVGEVTLRSAPFAPGDWHHVAIAVDATAGRLHLYVDGAAVAGSPLVFSGSLAPAPLQERGNWPEYAGRYRIGATSPGYTGDGDSDMIEGRIDDVQLYDGALGPAEIATSMAVPSALRGSRGAVRSTP